MNPITAVLTCYKKYADFSGRASRSEYWYSMLFIYLILILSSGFSENASEPVSMVGAIFYLASILPTWAVTWRRMHDAGSPGWWAFIPIAGLVIAVTRSEPNLNKYGPVPEHLPTQPSKYK